MNYKKIIDNIVNDWFFWLAIIIFLLMKLILGFSWKVAFLIIIAWIIWAIIVEIYFKWREKKNADKRES